MVFVVLVVGESMGMEMTRQEAIEIRKAQLEGKTVDVALVLEAIGVIRRTNVPTGSVEFMAMRRKSLLEESKRA